MARAQENSGRSSRCAGGVMSNYIDITFLDEEVKKMLIPFLDGEIVDNSKILVPSACKLQRSRYRGWTKKWLIH
jgi:hypothetical protein